MKNERRRKNGNDRQRTKRENGEELITTKRKEKQKQWERNKVKERHE